MGIGYSDYEATAMRYGINGTYPPSPETIEGLTRAGLLVDGRNYWHQYRFTDLIFKAIALLGGSLFGTILTYLFMSVTSFRDPYAERNLALLRSWWQWIK